MTQAEIEEKIKKWVMVYPCYLNSNLTIAEGRRIPRTKAVPPLAPGFAKDTQFRSGRKPGNKFKPRMIPRKPGDQLAARCRLFCEQNLVLICVSWPTQQRLSDSALWSK